MAEFNNCRICGNILGVSDRPIFVKVKGQRDLRWYCRECVKGGGKHDTTGERHRAEAHQDR